MGGRVGECLPEVVLDAPGILVGVQTELGWLGKERQLGGAQNGGLVLPPDSPGKALQLPMPDFSAGNGTTTFCCHFRGSCMDLVS